MIVFREVLFQGRSTRRIGSEEISRMNRKWMVWIVAPVLLTALYGCPKKKPATAPQDLDVNTTTVAPPPATTEEVTPAPVATPPQDVVETNPLDSPDLQV